MIGKRLLEKHKGIYRKKRGNDMEKIMIEGGHSLSGSVRINGAKNSAVALVPAAMMADSTVTIDGLPLISDVDTLNQILEDIGADIRQESNHTVHIDPSSIVSVPIPHGKVKKLRASVRINGAKNSAVALVPAAMMADSTVTIDGLPLISDVDTLNQILEDIGADIRQESNHTVHIDPSSIVSVPIPNGKVKKLRASYYFMGAMLGKFKKAVIGLPGGCYLGPRPIDQHIKGFEALGATVTNEKGAIYLEAEELHGARIYLDVVS